MPDETFDLPRATALLERLASDEEEYAQRPIDHNARAHAKAAVLLRSISRRLLAGERDRERLDWFDANVTKARRHQPDGNVSVSTFATPLLQPGHLSIRDALDCAARSSEGSPTNG